jgi:hypothetical protein
VKQQGNELEERNKRMVKMVFEGGGGRPVLDTGQNKMLL